jgi:HD superfamily phosphodiesterase
MNSNMDTLFQFVAETCKRFNIDESHGVSHSMDVLQYAHNIYKSELPEDVELQKIIYFSAILHDMCDKKYMDEELGWSRICEFIQDKVSVEEMDVIYKIIMNMSYSKVKQNGYPQLGKYQMAYHIVREADLLSAYDIDRCILYKFNQKGEFVNSYQEASELTYRRMLKQIEDGLFVTTYSKELSKKLHEDMLRRLKTWGEIYKKIEITKDGVV